MNDMKVYFKAGSELRIRLQPDVDFYTRSVETDEGKSVEQILTDIGVDPAFVAFVYTEGKLKGLDYVPQDGQSITLQPPVSGG
jgi:molybdopterin converting factor small subunit